MVVETDWEFEEYDYDDLEEDEDNEMVLDCGFEGCVMPGYHMRSECHNAEMLVQQELHAERAGKRCPDGDWIGDSQPGGMECGFCGCIFISNDGRPNCKVCHDRVTELRTGASHE